MDARRPDRTRAYLPQAVTAAALAALTLWAWGFVLALPPTGADAWPLLEQASRALHDPGVLWRERYLEGVPIGASFWRPLFVGGFALQWGAFGGTAWPYHALRLVAYLLLALGAGSLARRRPDAGESAAFAAGALVLLHPLQADLLPSLARSADVLADLALCATLACLARERPTRAALAFGALAALAAPAIKESGLIAPLVGLAVLEPWRAGDGRGRRATSLVLLVGLVAHLALRWQRLGSVGSYAAGDAGGSDALNNAALLAAGLADAARAWQCGLLALLVVASLALSHGSEDSTRSVARAWLRTRRGALVWLALALVGALASRRLAERHAVALLVPLAVLVAPSLGALTPRAGRERARTAARVLLALALLAVLAPRSPLWRHYAQWDVIAAATTGVLDAAEQAVRASEERSAPVERSVGVVRVRASRTQGVLRVAVAPFPKQAAPPTGPRAAALRQPMILMPYSIAAALRLRGVPGPIAIAPGRLLDVLPEHLSAR
ncbi:MAG TPA: hypothetical protein VMT18_01385 [Planctomycetota bacterium]|nr:hypothetical protein [Planctomycetota bacterium]